MDTRVNYTNFNKIIKNINDVNTNSYNKNKSKYIKPERLKFMHFNCNSIRNKVDHIQKFLDKEKPDALSLNEIKCNQVEANYLLRFEGYLPYFKARDSNGGGVALLIREDLEHNELDFLNECPEEVVGIKIILKNTTINLFSLYNAPNKVIRNGLLATIKNNAKNFVIAGDLNAKTPLLNRCYNRTGRALENSLNDLNIAIANSNSQFTSYRYKTDKITKKIKLTLR